MSELNKSTNDFFLSERNPLATTDQRELLQLALRVLPTEKVQKAKAMAAARVKTLVHGHANDEAWASFDRAMDEWTFNYVLKAVNADPNYPKILNHIYAPPYRSFGIDVPGNRAFGGENPDTIYNLIPIDPYARYELSGQKFNDVCDVPIQLCSNLSLSSTLGSLPWEDVVFESDGRFFVHIGPQPANGETNYIQSKAEAKFLLIRNTRSDWNAKPVAFRIKRLDPPVAPPLRFEDIVDRAALFVVDDIPMSLYWLAMVDMLERNTFSPAFITGGVGGMWTARMSFGKLTLADDEYAVLTVGSAGARFRNLVLMNYWQHSVAYGERLTSLSDKQSIESTDGTTTYVIGKQDPGIYNWVDTTGLKDTKVMLRWQQLPRDDCQEEPPVHLQIVKTDELESVLPKDIMRVSSTEREHQLAERIKSHQLRFLDH